MLATSFFKMFVSGVLGKPRSVPGPPVCGLCPFFYPVDSA